ncbi:CocE/NonD family hydrolase [Neobacillus dielmonensis]|uniref:CocE/NonD family hydrolase n=1 Tax=Neobacillus dielmonensis TaxID=1347369 RepID=UPI000694B4A3|nr:CocE/NonD family hydrolase [Neobacillus dielmonensis]
MLGRKFRTGLMALVMSTTILSPVLSSASKAAAASSSTTVTNQSKAITQPVQKWDNTMYDRFEEYSSYTTMKDVKITMRDGIVLYADVHIPEGTGPFPVILTQTPYNKNTPVSYHKNEYLVKRGYVHVAVDVRGTGSSQGTWDSFGIAEQQDGKELVEWAASQPWSDGKVGLYGPSYMGINQFFTAAQHPKGLKALFPIVPMADEYRDIVMSGGLVNTGFIPLWMGLVAGMGLQPPSYTIQDPLGAVSVLLNHAGGLINFPVSSISSALSGGDFAYDGPAAWIRSPYYIADQVDVPAFISGGLHDLFQRGEPLLYEKLKAKGVTAKLLMGPWTHGDFGSGLPGDNVPSLDQLALRWFDQYLKGINTNIEKIPDVTQFVLGDGHYEVQPGWPHAKASAQKYYLRGNKALTKEMPATGEASKIMVQQPVNGICSQSTSQWTAGMLGVIPCTKDNRLTELTEVTYTTPPMSKDFRISGPIAANIFAKTTARELVLSVRITDVAPDGTSTELTAGWLAASHRATDSSKSRYLDGVNIQPWHAFTKEAQQTVRPNEVMELNVEIFPTNAVIKEGHSLRVAIGPSDFPHTVAPLPSLLNGLLGFATILSDQSHPSSVILPVVE